ncbi:MAG: hypothetical protein HZB67_00235 [Candidatus Aenigmarchaeota archaeon]|nr:hypothetical protein [Candidatus Aenigmarchaeota archaeon]
MVTTALPEVKERLVVPAVSSSYPTLGAAYNHGSYEVKYADRLVRTGKNYYDSKAEIPEGYRMSTAGEELAMQLALERIDKDPRKAAVFDDIFGRNNGGWYAWQWTETGLRVPKGRKADAYETDAQGRKYRVRIVLDGDKEVAEILVPEGDDRLVAEWDEVFGVPRVTIENADYPHKPYTTHFWFNATPNIDDRSGHYDVAVGRRSAWHHGVDESCLHVDAYYRRLSAYSRDGLRLVRGSVPEIEKELARINPTDVENALLERIRADINGMPLKEFMAKYKL